jgi:protocatechuate 3,4-dioxygenase beta subunit
LALLLALVGAGSALGQAPARDPRAPGAAPPAGSASIAGTVIVAGSGQPARRARVNLSSSEPRLSLSKATDDQGRFAFTDLPAGRYSLSASKAGHVTASFGQHRPGRPGTPIQLADGQQFQAHLQMPRGGAITGILLDEHGEATPGILVRAMRWTLTSGERRLQPAGSGSTDDRGIYRVYGLQPGEYVVCATPRGTVGPDIDRMRIEMEAVQRAVESAAQREAEAAAALAQRVRALEAQLRDDEQSVGYAPVCFPGTATPSGASAVALGPGEERAGVDFQLQLVPFARVEGIVMNPSGAPLQNTQLSLVVAGDGPSPDRRTARADAEGRFRFTAVPPGQYTLVARATMRLTPGQPRTVSAPLAMAGQRAAEVRRAAEQPSVLYSMLDVPVDGRNLTDLILTLQPGLTVSGQIAFDGATPPPADLSRARITLSAVDPGPLRGIATSASARADATGRFTINNVLPGRYRLSGSSGASGWVVDSAVINGQETADFPVEIRGGQNVTGATLTFTDRQSEFAGTVVNERSEPVSVYTVIVYPADQRYWTGPSRRIQTNRPGTDGRFTFRNLPPGDYRLATVFDPEPGSWYDPAYLQQLDGSSTRFSIAAGEKKALDVRVSTSRQQAAGSGQ